MLAIQPAEQALFALEIVRDVRDPSLLGSALAILAVRSLREAHGPLVELYTYLDAAGPKRDPGGFTRMGVINALRPIAMLEDLALFERATSTYEHSVQEAGSPSVLRAAGVMALNQLDDRLAAHYAARLLAERDRTSPMTAEPARSAALVLGAMGHTVPLLLVALEGTHHAEVLAEAIRAQVELAPPLLAPLAESVREANNPATDLGWLDLLATYHDSAIAAGYLKKSLAAATEPEIYRYAVTVAIASRKIPLVEQVIASANTTTDRDRIAILIDALPLAEGQADTREVVAKLRGRVGRSDASQPGL